MQEPLSNSIKFQLIVPCLLCISLSFFFFLQKIFISAIRDPKVEMSNEPGLKVEGYFSHLIMFARKTPAFFFLKQERHRVFHILL